MDERNYQQQQQQQNPNATGYQQPYRPDFQPQLYRMPQQTSAYPPSSVYHQPDLHSSMASMHIGANNSGRHQMSSMPWNPNAPIFRPSNAPQYGNTTGYYTDMNGYGMQQHQQQPESVVYEDCQFVAAPGRDDTQGFFFDPQIDEALAAAAAQQVPLTPELSAAMMHSTNASLLQEVQVGLEQLIAEPDEFETWSGAIRDRLINKSMTNDGLQIATQLILEMALLGPHVQYNFAKLCVYLSNTVDKTNGGNIVDFRAQFLLPQLRILHTEKRWYLNSSQLQNLAYFFAEIFTHFETPQGKHFDVFAIPLFEQLKELLNPPYMESSVKTVIQVLKLTGYGLDAATNGKELMNALFALLTDVLTGDISESLKNQIKNLQILRSEKWGRNSAPPPSSTTSTSATNGRSGSNAVDTSLYIGPDGKPLTDDEQAFLEENLGRLDSTSGCDSHSLTEDREFIDDYEKFLASQN